MSDDNWRHRHALTALALALLALIVIAWLDRPSDQSSSTPEGPQIEQAQRDDVSQLVAAIREFNPWDDTYAQWLMAIFGVAATFISYKAVVLVRDTLELNRAATKAAQDAVAVSREIGEAQARAYISFSHIETTLGTEAGGTERTVAFVPYIKNTGQTPANIAYMASQTLIQRLRSDSPFGHIDEAVPPIRNVSIEGIRSHLVSHEMGQGSEFFFNSAKFSIEALNDCYVGRARIFSFGVFYFTDIFFPKSRLRKGEFFYQIRPISDPSKLAPEMTDSEMGAAVQWVSVGGYTIHIDDEPEHTIAIPEPFAG